MGAWLHRLLMGLLIILVVLGAFLCWFFVGRVRSERRYVDLSEGPPKAMPGETPEERDARIQRQIRYANEYSKRYFRSDGSLSRGSDQIHVGPRGGRYRYDSRGRKRYDV